LFPIAKRGGTDPKQLGKLLLREPEMPPDCGYIRAFNTEFPAWGFLAPQNGASLFNARQ
jgi:hypothetical protein